ncbi:MAG: hypothetical protein CVU56_21490 [Deltaproteobacteria bacterium HGW-Deltaproteobacteria-14]|jgi:signal transduction histidine kinase|nr:MAG: hypothetical protein CVU56_21490 [Deltaproteobacteria bacterium HGW-Deltaproteobacteria-14]
MESLEGVYAALDDAVLVSDADSGRIVDCSPAAERALRGSRGELVGSPLRALYPRAEEFAALVTATTFRGACVVRRLDGSTCLTEHTSIRVVGAATGTPLRVTVIFRDVTAARDAEEAQARALRRLERRYRHLVDLVTAAAHDLEAPLRAVGTLASWLAADLGDRVDATGREHIALMLSRVRRMYALVEGTLRYARAVDAVSVVGPVALDDVVGRAVAAVGAPRRIRVHVERPLPIVRGDSSRLQLAIEHLLRNAVEFHDKPAGEVLIRCVALADGWRVEVRDDGPGIARPHHDRIFQPFQTLASRDEHESAGIGLALVRAIVEEHAGVAGVESAPGAGSTFFFTLPAEVA